MKKFFACMIVIVLIIVNLFFPPAKILSNSFQFSLSVLESRADDDEGENDPPDPKEELPPFRPFPTDWSPSAFTGYFF